MAPPPLTRTPSAAAPPARAPRSRPSLGSRSCNCRLQTDAVAAAAGSRDNTVIEYGPAAGRPADRRPVCDRRDAPLRAVSIAPNAEWLRRRRALGGNGGASRGGGGGSTGGLGGGALNRTAPATPDWLLARPAPAKTSAPTPFQAPAATACSAAPVCSGAPRPAASPRSRTGRDMPLPVASAGATENSRNPGPLRCRPICWADTPIWFDGAKIHGVGRRRGRATGPTCDA